MPLTWGLKGLENSVPSPPTTPTVTVFPLTIIWGEDKGDRELERRPEESWWSWWDLGGARADGVHQLAEEGGGVAEGCPVSGE